MERRLKIGVIGLGMGKGHIRGYLTHHACDVVAIADPDPKRLKEVGEAYKISRRYATGEAMIAKEKLDIVSVATPNKFHAPLTIKALKRGAHVLCEKPMAMNAKEAAAMLAMAKKMKRRIMINFSYRFTQPAQALKKAVDHGAVGSVYFARTMWHRSRGMPGFGGWFGQKKLAGGGPLIDLGVHRIDLALWLMGYPKPVWVMAGAYDRIAGPLAKSSGKKFDVEDMATGYVRFANGATLAIEASWAANRPEAERMETRLYGDHGGLAHFNKNETYDFVGEVYKVEGGRVVKTDPPAVTVPPGGSMNHFAEAILRNRPHIADGSDGVTVMKLLDAIYASAASGKPVRVGRG